MSSSPSPSSSASPPASTASPPSPSSPPAAGASPPPQIPSPATPLSSPPPPEATSPPSGTAPSPPVPSRSPPPEATSPPSDTGPSPPVPSRSPPPDATSPPPGTGPSPQVPSRSPPPAASPPPPSTVAPPPPSPSVPPQPTTPNAPTPFPPSPPPPASQPPQSRPPPTDTPPRSSPSHPPHPPASSSPPWLPPPSPPRNSSAAPNPPSLSPSLTVTPPATSTDSNRPNPDGTRNSTTPEHGSGLKPGSVVAIGVVAALIAFGLVGLAVCFIRKHKKAVAEYNAGFVIASPPASSMSDSAILRSQTAPLVQRRNFGTTSRINSLSETPRAGTTPSFSFEELYRITNGFSPDNILGEGGFGFVYKGCLSNGREVAVKRLKIESGQGDREFKAEVEIISRVHHRHLVSLVGYCISENQRLLVYDFVPNGTLESHLHGNTRPIMDWATRVKVATGAARGISYLHEDCNPKIIHRDIKSSNILLDNNFEAQVADFGLAKLALESDAHTHVTTRVMGTFGYLAPEYACSGKLTEKSDVFSFGVVLLELITGQKPVDNTKSFGDESLVLWARPLLSHALTTGELGELPDHRLQKNFNIREMLCMIEAAAACTRHSASMRPQMGKVVRVLDGFADIDLTSGVAPGQSETFNVANSADIRIFQQLALGNPGSTSDYAHSNWSHEKDA